jgi:PhnB protein
MKLGATLYVQNSNDAVDYYMRAFRMTLGYNAKNPDGSYLHAELLKNGDSIFAVSESTDEEFRKVMLTAPCPTMSYGINLDNDEELNVAYSALCEGGHVLRPLGPLPWSRCSADVVDKFGVYWYIYVSQHKPEGDL